VSGRPLGIGLAVADGALTFRVQPIDRAADRVWDAVREAIDAGMTPERFRSEAAEAWEHHLTEDGKHAAETLGQRRRY
jgi:N-acetylglucosamine kinase-like BadF-type ATPase